MVQAAGSRPVDQAASCTSCLQMLWGCHHAAVALLWVAGYKLSCCCLLLLMLQARAFYGFQIAIENIHSGKRAVTAQWFTMLFW